MPRNNLKGVSKKTFDCSSLYNNSQGNGRPAQGKDLQGLEFNLTMYWNVMPFTGIFHTNKVIVPGFQLPQRNS